MIAVAVLDLPVSHGFRDGIWVLETTGCIGRDGKEKAPEMGKTTSVTAKKRPLQRILAGIACGSVLSENDFSGLYERQGIYWPACA